MASQESKSSVLSNFDIARCGFVYETEASMAMRKLAKSMDKIVVFGAPIEPGPRKYADKIIQCFKDLCAKQSDGASPAEVTKLMHERGWLGAMDTVLDIADDMEKLRGEGRL